jgi:hypothetical protein
MGVGVTLDILPRGIEAGDWAKAYDETVRVLAEHPAGLLGLGWKAVNGARVRVLTRSIERCLGDGARREWCVAGDRRDLVAGEPPTMLRDLGRYPSPANGEPRDILLCLDAECCGGLVRVFSMQQAGGARCHQALLTAAMVVESRFPGRAVVGGDLDRDEALEARDWAERVLGRRVELPVRIRPEALAGRLSEHFPPAGNALVQAFDRLYIDAHHRRPVVLLKTFDRDLGERWVLSRLESYRPGSLGAIRVMVAWLDATGDLARLCALACLDERGPRMQPAELAATLADTWVGLPAAVTEGLDLSPRSIGWPHAVDEKLLASLYDMQIPGRHLETRLDLGHVGRVFEEVFGVEGSRAFEVFRERTSALAAYIDSTRDERETAEVRGPRCPDDAADVPLDIDATDDLGPAQLDVLRKLASAVCRLETSLETRAPEASALFSPRPEPIRHVLTLMLVESGPRLSEAAWDAIEREDDPRVLRFLLCLLLMRDGKRPLDALRRAMFENGTLRTFVLRAAGGEAIHPTV